MRTPIELLTFDVLEWLDKKGVPYDSEGKNISTGWVGIECPFCPDSDPSNHLGINLEKKTINCWRCSEGKGTVLKLVMKLERCPREQALSIMKNFRDAYYRESERETVTDASPRSNRQLSLSSFNDFSEQLSTQAIAYLVFRNFNPRQIQKDYKILSCGPIGKWKHRIIIPIYMNNRLVSFTSRSTINAEPEYLNCPNSLSITPVKESIYNIDTVNQTAIIVEGPLDVWRIGSQCVSTFGKRFTLPQLLLLKRKNIKRGFVLYDEDAKKDSQELGFMLSNFIHDVEIIYIKEDPAEFSHQDVKNFRRELLGKL